MMRAHLAFDIITTSQVAANPDLLKKYQAIVAAACDYATRPVFDALQKTETTVYLTPESALTLPNAVRLKHNFNEVYLLFRHLESRDRRTYDHLIDQRAAYLNEMFSDIKRDASAASDDVLTHVLQAPGCHVLTLVNATMTWPDNRPIEGENLKKVREIVGEDFAPPAGLVISPEVRTTVTTSLGTHVYDLRHHAKISTNATGQSITFDYTVAGRGEGALLLVTPTAFGQFTASEKTDGSVTTVHIEARDAAGKSLSWALPVRVDVIAPGGERAEEHSTRLITADGRAAHSIEWPTNEISGEWRIVVIEMTTGTTQEVRVSR
jgi:hypothetical protein